MIETLVLQFCERVYTSLKEGYEVVAVDVEPNDDGTLLACAMTPDGSVLVSQEYPACERDDLEQLLAVMVAFASGLNRMIGQDSQAAAVNG